MKWKLVLVCFLLFSIAHSVYAEETNITYSGYMSSSGSPISGDYDMKFRLYDVETDGAPLDIYSTNVAVTDGYFTTELKFDKQYFDGRALWLGMQVETDSEMSPRLKLNEVPYSTSPKFLITEQQVNFTGLKVKEGLNVNTTKDEVQGVYSNTTGNQSAGVYARTHGESSPGAFAWTSGNESDGFFTRTDGDDSKGFVAYTLGDSSEGVRAYTEGIGSEGVHASTKGKYSYGVYAETDGNFSEGVHASTKGKYSYGVYVDTDGYGSEGFRAWTGGDQSDGFRALTYGDESEGVYAKTYGQSSDGIQAWTYGNSSEGVRAYTEGIGSEGVYANTKGEDSPALYGTSDKSYGVYGEGNFGGYFTTNQPGEYLDRNAAITAETEGDYSNGVYAETDGDESGAVKAITNGYLSKGVFAKTYGNHSEGVAALTYGDNSEGFRAKTYGNYSGGLYARIHGDHSEGVYARTEGFKSDGFNAVTIGEESNGVEATTYGEKSNGVEARTDGNFSDGFRAWTGGDQSEGVYARTNGAYSDGVHAYTEGDYSEGVSAYSEKFHGVKGKTLDESSYGGLFLNPDGDSLAAGTDRDEIKFRVRDDGDVMLAGQNLYLNNDGPDGHTFIWFYDRGSPTGKYIKWDDSNDQFSISDSLNINGDMTATGTKSFVMDHPQDDSKELVYAAQEGGEAGVYTRGTASLEDGVAVVELPEHFGLVANEEGLTVQVTPLGNCNGLYVEQKSTSEIVVKELMNGDSDVEFDYNVQGIRKGYEDFEVIRSK